MIRCPPSFQGYDHGQESSSRQRTNGTGTHASGARSPSQGCAGGEVCGHRQGCRQVRGQDTGRGTHQANARDDGDAEASLRHPCRETRPPKKQADTLLAAVFGMVVDHLKAGERVRIGGLGIIEVKDSPARMGRNPATGASVQIAASRKVGFRTAKELKAAV